MSLDCTIEQVEFLHRHLSYLEVSGKPNEIDWEKITDLLNEMGPPTYGIRDWKKVWMCNKSRVKKTFFREYNKTPGWEKTTREPENLAEIEYIECEEPLSPEQISSDKASASREGSPNKPADKNVSEFKKQFDRIAYSCRICLMSRVGLTKLDEKLKFMFEKLTGRTLESHEISLMKICSDCKSELTRSYKFRLLCLKSEREILSFQKKHCKKTKKKEGKNDGRKLEKKKKEDKRQKEIDDEEAFKIIQESVERVKKSPFLAPGSSQEMSPIVNTSCVDADSDHEPPDLPDMDDEELVESDQTVKKTTSTSPITVKTQMETCKICDRHLKAVNMDIHMKKHHSGENPSTTHKCTICAHTFSTDFLLQNHYNQNHKARNYKCGICQKKYHTQYHASLHEAKCTMAKDQRKTYTCPYCITDFYEQKKLDDHIRVKHTRERPYQCHECGHYMATQNSLRSHMYKHRKSGFVGPERKQRKIRTRKRPTNKNSADIPCPVCGILMETEYQWVAHIADEHSGEQENQSRSLTCQFCNKTFPEKKLLETHIEKIHLEQNYAVTEEDDIIVEHLIEVDEQGVEIQGEL